MFLEVYVKSQDVYLPDVSHHLYYHLIDLNYVFKKYLIPVWRD